MTGLLVSCPKTGWSQNSQFGHHETSNVYPWKNLMLTAQQETPQGVTMEVYDVLNICLAFGLSWPHSNGNMSENIIFVMFHDLDATPNVRKCWKPNELQMTRVSTSVQKMKTNQHNWSVFHSIFEFWGYNNQKFSKLGSIFLKMWSGILTWRSHCV